MGSHPFLHYFRRQGFSLNLELLFWLIWPGTSKATLASTPSTGVPDSGHHARLSPGPADWNSDPCACIANSFPQKPSSYPPGLILKLAGANSLCLSTCLEPSHSGQLALHTCPCYPNSKNRQEYFLM